MKKTSLISRLADPKKKLLIIGPHPDDAEFSTGRLLIRRKGKNSHVICLTDGRKGQESKKKIPEDKFAELRIKESKKALNELNASYEFLRIFDQALASNPFVIDWLYLAIKKLSPDFLLVPPYEGAHPDHDAAHLFAIIASRNIGFSRANIIEYASYNNYSGKFNVQKFIPKETREFILKPRPNEQKRWLDIMGIFKSQISLQNKYVLLSKNEKYRVLPKYDYSRLPYSSRQSEIIRKLFYPIASKIIPKTQKLYYETWNSSLNPVKVKESLNKHAKEYALSNIIE